jgi:hypothetical protein
LGIALHLKGRAGSRTGAELARSDPATNPACISIVFLSEIGKVKPLPARSSTEPPNGGWRREGRMTDLTRLLAMDAVARPHGGGLNPALRALLESSACLDGAFTAPFPVHSAGPAQQPVPRGLPPGVSRLLASAPRQARKVQA